MKLPQELTTVTPLSKFIAFILFITFPFLGILLGIHYQKSITPDINTAIIIPTSIKQPAITSVISQPQRNTEANCKLVPEPGMCKAFIPKYYFDQNFQQCKEFIWGGCEGVVPFESLEECENTCISLSKKQDARSNFPYTCVPKFPVESGPELTASQAYSQECYKMKTKEGCEEVDVYRESTNNFGNSDGISDCQWIDM